MYLFAPAVIETLCVFGKQTLEFLEDLACHVRKVPGRSVVLFISTSMPCFSCRAR